MESRLSWEEYVDFLKGSFLSWMKSRSSREKICYGVYNSGVLSLEVYIEILNKSSRFSKDEIRRMLNRFCAIKGVGPVLASAMITVINPDKYGIVSKYTIKVLNSYKLREYSFNNRNIDGVVEVIEEMRAIQSKVNKTSKKHYSVRNVDMALWGYGNV